jgi:signal transduction histidine kinase
MPLNTIQYMTTPSRWRGSWRILMPTTVAEILIAYIGTHNTGTFVGAVVVLTITLPMIVAVSREPGIGVFLALIGSLGFLYWSPTAQNSNFYLVVAIWVGSTFTVAVASHHQHLLRDQLTSRILMAEGEERARIANDLHDDTVQVLVAALLRLESIPDTSNDEAFQKAMVSLREALARLRSLSFQLRPPQLASGGLPEAIPDLCADIAPRLQEIGAQLDCYVAPAVSRYAPMAEELIHRTVLEALTNALKHSKATQVNVSVTQDGSLRAVISDDGRGFDVRKLGETLDDRYHMGLPAKRERMEWAGGRMDSRSIPGQGTTIDVSLPVHGLGAPVPEPVAARPGHP